MAPNSTDKGMRLTPLAALLNTLTTATMGKSLGTYLAIARTPGTGWKSYDDIADDLGALLAGVRTMNRVSVKTMSDGYGIPHTRYVEGYSMPRPVSDEAVESYLDALSPVLVDLPTVRQAAIASQAQDRAARTGDSMARDEQAAAPGPNAQG